jgi:tRNA pseudouridine55 synthase
VLDDISALALNEEETQKIRNGMGFKTDLPDTETLRLMHNDKLVALAKVEDGLVRPFRVFNY